MDYFDWERFKSAFIQIMPYLHVTLEFVIICVVLSTIFAVILAVLRIKNVPVVREIMGVYVSYMRGTPFLVQLMVVYYGLPVLVNALFGINIIRWDGMIFALIAMIMNEAAFLGETIRGAILSISAIQSEAGYSIGMTNFQTFMHIVLPQVIKILVPAYGTTLVGMLQSTSMLYTIGVVDIIQRSKSIASATGHAFEGYAVCALIYIVASLLIKLVFTLLEKKMSYGKAVA